MQLRNSQEQYGVLAQLFHWAIVALIITQFVLASKAEALPLGLAKIAVLAQHKSVGMTVFGLAIVRLLWRFMNPVPPMPASTPGWQRVAAHISHGALYALILITPLFGWMMSSARNFPVSYFGLFTFPDLVQPDKQLYEFFRDAHVLLAQAMFFVALLHALAALKHHFFERDNVLRRMLPVRLKSDRP